MRDLSELNINDGGERVQRSSPRDEDFSAFESKFQVRLPPELRTLLLHANGGHPELDSIAMDPQGHDRYAVTRFYFLNLDEVPGSIAYAFMHWTKILGAAALPFARDGGGNQFFIDTRDGSVNICLHDADMRIVPLATSFEDFIDRLEVDPEMI